MKGNIKVIVSTKKQRYELNLRRNITVIQGDSATGKTTLIQIVSDYLSGRTGTIFVFEGICRDCVRFKLLFCVYCKRRAEYAAV